MDGVQVVFYHQADSLRCFSLKLFLFGLFVIQAFFLEVSPFCKINSYLNDK